MGFILLLVCERVVELNCNEELWLESSPIRIWMQQSALKKQEREIEANVAQVIHTAMKKTQAITFNYQRHSGLSQEQKAQHLDISDC